MFYVNCEVVENTFKLELSVSKQNRFEWCITLDYKKTFILPIKQY